MITSYRRDRRREIGGNRLTPENRKLAGIEAFGNQATERFRYRMRREGAAGCATRNAYGVGAVSVVAFTYDIDTIPSQNNGVLGATLTMRERVARDPGGLGSRSGDSLREPDRAR